MQQITVSYKSLSSLIPFCSKDKDRYILTGVKVSDIEINKKFYRVYEATDGTKLARIYKPIKKIELKDCIILKADDLKKIKTKKDILYCDIDKTKHRVEIENTIIEDLDGVYVNTEAVLVYTIDIPKQFIKNDKYFYIRGTNIETIERFFNNNEKINSKTDFINLNQIMTNQHIKEKTKMLGYFDAKNYKQVVVMPIV